MRKKLQALVGKIVPFFDKSGGVLSVEGRYQRDWWHQSDLLILEARKKDFVAQDLTTEQKVNHRYSAIIEASEKGIVFN